MALKLKTDSAVNVATAGTRVQLTSSDTIFSSIIIQAKSANTGIIYVGDSSVSSANGLELSAGESLEISGDLRNEGQTDELVMSDLWIDASVNGEGVKIARYIKRN